MNVLPDNLVSDGGESVDYGRLVADHTRDVIVVTGIEGRILWVNPAFERVSEYTLSEAIGRKPGSFLQGPDTDRETVRQLSRKLAERVAVKVDLLNYTKSGRPYWIELDISPVFDAEGRHTAFVAVERVITVRKAVEIEMERSRRSDARRRQERRVLAEMSEWLYATETFDELCQVVAQSLPRLLPNAEGALFVYRNSRDRLEPVATFGGKKVSGVLMPSDCWALRRGRAHTYGGEILNIPCNHRASTGTASVCVPLLAHGEALGILVVAFKDIPAAAEFDEVGRADFDERRHAVLTSAKQIGLSVANVRLRTALRTQSTRDVLTGLPNRRALLEALRQSFGDGGTPDALLSVLSFDVDHFKTVNDTFGHAVGDLALKSVASIASEVIGDRGMVARMGGEEFVAILPGMPSAAAANLADTVRQEVEERMRHEGAGAPVTVSIGVATVPDHASSPEEVLSLADRALYAAKRSGRNRICLAPAPPPDGS